VVGRILAEQLGRRFNQRFIVENRVGANAGLAAQQVKGAAPDGYTLMLGSSGTLSIAPNLNDRLPYDVARDFTPIGLVASYPYFLVVPTASPISDVKDLVRRAKAEPGKLSFASAGNGSVNHLAGEWFKAAGGFDAVHVPYKGDSAALSDLVAQRVDFAFISGVVATPQVKGGKLRALAVASMTPGRGGPGVPTMVDAGIPDFAAEPWNGVMGPAGMHPDLVRKLNEAINEAMQRPEVTEKLLPMGQYAFSGTPQAFRDQIARQTARWAEIIKLAKVPKE
jgi:tripartite-type tricarboxylate transporter receptor subunit TctC